MQLPSQPIDVFGTEIVLTFELPFSWTALYFSGLFTVAASVVNWICCPRFIAEHPDVRSLNNSGVKLATDKGFLTLATNDPEVRHALRIEAPYANYGTSPGVKKFLGPEPNKIEVDALISSFARQDEAGAYGTVIRSLDNRRPTARIIITVLYVLAVISIGIVLIQNLIWVLAVLFRP